jgi:ferritin
VPGGTAVKATIEDAFNDQLRNEYQASYLYLSMSAWFEAQDYPGFAQWMQMQSQEEKEHAMRFYDHLVDRDARVQIPGIEETPSAWDSALDVFESAYEHEQTVTSQINRIYDAADEDGDRPLQNMLDWFVDEQVEEESTFKRILELFELTGDEDQPDLLEIDEYLEGHGHPEEDGGEE